MRWDDIQRGSNILAQAIGGVAGVIVSCAPGVFGFHIAGDFSDGFSYVVAIGGSALSVYLILAMLDMLGEKERRREEIEGWTKKELMRERDLFKERAEKAGKKPA